MYDDGEDPFKWVFPEGTSVDAGEYLLVWASGKDRYQAPFHTNFSIKKEGEEILLSAPDETVVDMLNPIEIPDDISYGRTKADPSKWAFFSSPTPGQENSGPEGHFLLETIDFSQDSCVFTSQMNVSLSGAQSGHVIRYTTDGSRPGANSPLYDTPFALSQTTTIRACVFDPAGGHGEIFSRHYIYSDSCLAGQKSYLPIVVMDAHGQDLTKTVTSSGSVKYNAYFFLFDRDSEGISSLSGVPSLSTRQSLRCGIDFYTGTFTGQQPAGSGRA